MNDVMVCTLQSKSSTLLLAILLTKMMFRHYQMIWGQSSALMMSWFQVQKKLFPGPLLIGETNFWKGFFMPSVPSLISCNWLICWNLGTWMRLTFSCGYLPVGYLIRIQHTEIKVLWNWINWQKTTEGLAVGEPLNLLWLTRWPFQHTSFSCSAITITSISNLFCHDILTHVNADVQIILVLTLVLLHRVQSTSCQNRYRHWMRGWMSLPVGLKILTQNLHW